MDRDKIIKLIKLANSNPNDAEANSAARLVCKELADYDFPESGAFYDRWCLRHKTYKTICKCG